MAETNRLPIPKEVYPKLLELINETYDDGMESIQEATSDSDGSLRGIAIDEGKKFAFEYANDTLELRLLTESDSQTAGFAAGKKRNCQKGISCGGSCISKTKTCKKKASGNQQEKAKEITALVHVPGKGSPAPTKQKAVSKAKKETKAKIPKVSAKEQVKIKEAIEDAKARSTMKVSKETKQRIGNLSEDIGDPAKMTAKDLMTVLLDTDGDNRLTMLGITKKFYAPKSILPKELLKTVSKKIHPDVNKDPRATKAMVELNDMFENMSW